MNTGFSSNSYPSVGLISAEFESKKTTTTLASAIYVFKCFSVPYHCLHTATLSWDSQLKHWDKSPSNVLSPRKEVTHCKRGQSDVVQELLKDSLDKAYGKEGKECKLFRSHL